MNTRTLSLASLPLLAAAAGFSVYESTRNFAPPAPTLREVLAELPATSYRRDASSTFKGLVLDAQGQPVPDCTVTVQSWVDQGVGLGPLALHPETVTGSTDAHGEFQLEGLPFGMTRVEAKAPDGRSALVLHKTYLDGSGTSGFELTFEADNVRAALEPTPPREVDPTAGTRFVDVHRPAPTHESHGLDGALDWSWYSLEDVPPDLAHNHPLSFVHILGAAPLAGRAEFANGTARLALPDAPGVAMLTAPGLPPMRLATPLEADQVELPADGFPVQIRTVLPSAPFIIEDASGVQLCGFTDVNSNATVVLTPGVALCQTWADTDGRASQVSMIRVDGREDKFEFNRLPGLDPADHAVFGLFQGALFEPTENVQVYVQSAKRSQVPVKNDDGLFWAAGLPKGWVRVTAMRKSTGAIISESVQVEIGEDAAAVQAILPLLPNYFLIERAQVGASGRLELTQADGQLYASYDIAETGDAHFLFIPHVKEGAFSARLWSPEGSFPERVGRIHSLPLADTSPGNMPLTHLE